MKVKVRGNVVKNAKQTTVKKPKLTKVDGTDPSIVDIHKQEYRPIKRW